MRIGIVSQWYPPEPVFIPGSLAAELTARGHEVRVLTGFPNYPEGRLYPGFRQRWNHRSTEGELTVRRVPLYPSHDASTLRRVANYLSFAASSSVAAPRYLADVDAVYVYHPPATVFAAPALLRLLRRKPVVLHVQDIWPDSVTESSMAPVGGAGAALHRVLSAAMRRVYGASAAIAVTAPSMRDLVVERGADPATLRVVLNWTDESLFRPVRASDSARHAVGGGGRRTVMYAGNIGQFQNLDTAVRAAAAIEHVAPLDLVIVGSGTEEAAVRDLVRQLGAGNVRFLGRRSPADMAELYAAADYQLILLRDLAIFRGTIPSKLQAALACGSPVLVSAAGDCARFVDETGVGLSCPPDDTAALAARFVEAASIPAERHAEMARRARDSYRERMSMSTGVDQFEALLAAAAGARTRQPQPIR